MFLSILVVLCFPVLGSAAVDAYRAVDCTAGQDCMVLCEYRFSAAAAWCKRERGGTYRTVAKTTDAVLGRVSMLVLPSRARALVHFEPVLEKDAGEYRCGYWTTESNREVLYLQERILLRVHKAVTVQTSTVTAAANSSNTTEGTVRGLGSDKDILIISVVIASLLLAVLVGVFIFRRKSKRNKIGTAGHLGSVSVNEFPYSNEPVLTDITYAVLTLSPHGATEQGSHRSSQSERPVRLPEVVEYSSINF
ncbi:hypothetical protein MATL_G00110740 [Megalops atlanticus]|uniref:Uncharacterized protein n=1 Tax=Megalops atlanticus TaxID=7932 RepID=A0A9D3TCK0_MEGAT|nr:hypothetical protein MATL_G00110740 [Megalops atlanticus]